MRIFLKIVGTFLTSSISNDDKLVLNWSKDGDFSTKLAHEMLNEGKWSDED